MNLLGSRASSAFKKICAIFAQYLHFPFGILIILNASLIEKFLCRDRRVFKEIVSKTGSPATFAQTLKKCFSKHETSGCGHLQCFCLPMENMFAQCFENILSHYGEIKVIHKNIHTFTQLNEIFLFYFIPR